MEANLKKTLPQEGTDNLLVGESLGGPSGSSCPSYSGEGKDRHRAAVPRNEENIEVPRVQESLPSCVKSSSSSASTPKGNVNWEKNTKEWVNTIYESQRLQVHKELENLVLALQTKKQGIEKIEDKSSTFLHNYMLDSVAVIKKVAIVMGNKDKLILEKAAFEIKEAVEGILKLPENIEENPQEVEKTIPLIKPTESSAAPSIPVLPAPPTPTVSSASSAPLASLIVDNKQVNNNQLITFLKNYFQKTIKEYIDTCEDELLHDKDGQSNVNITSSKNSSTDTVKPTGTEKKKEDTCKLAPAPEPIYDVWYEMDRFKDFAMKCIEREGAEIPAQSLFFEPAEDAAEAKVQKSRDVVKLQRQQPFWLTADITELRRAYMSARRQYSRARRRRQQDEAAEMEHYAVYRSAKRALNAAINKAKSEGKEIPTVDEHEDSEEDSESS